MEKITKILIRGSVLSALLLIGAVSYSPNQELFSAVTTLGVQGGGTGANGFPKYPIVGGSGTAALSASSTPWVVGINATSTTASSTFQGLQAQSLDVQGSSATSTFANGLRFSGGSLQMLLTGCNGGSVLETDASGNLQCGTDSEGSAVYPFTPSAEGNATSTRILLNNGFISSASSTISSNLSVSTLSSGLVASGNGLLYGGIATGTVSGTGGVTVTASRSAIGGALAIDCTAASGSATGCLSSTDWTTFNNKSGFGYPFLSNSTSTLLTFSGGLLSTASSTFSSTLMTSGLLTANNGILSIASSTFSSNLDLSGGTVKQRLYPAFTYATSTAWTGTTTIPLGPAYQAETWNNAKCFTNAGTVRIGFNDGTNFMNPFQASTTVGTILLNESNSFTASEKRYVDIGNPASSPTKVSCTIEKIVN